MAMLEIATADDTGFSVSPIEAEYQGPSYTIETIAILRKRFDDTTSFYYVIGLDAFAEIRTWKNYLTLLRKVIFVVIDRPDLYKKSCEEIIQSELDGYVTSDNVCWRHDNGSTIYRLTMESVPVSSTTIRELLRKGCSVAGMVPAIVLDYIHKNNLYSK